MMPMLFGLVMVVHIAWSISQWGFRAEAATRENTYQPNATNMVMDCSYGEFVGVFDASICSERVF